MFPTERNPPSKKSPLSENIPGVRWGGEESEFPILEVPENPFRHPSCVRCDHRPSALKLMTPGRSETAGVLLRCWTRELLCFLLGEEEVAWGPGGVFPGASVRGHWPRGGGFAPQSLSPSVSSM